MKSIKSIWFVLLLVLTPRILQAQQTKTTELRNEFQAEIFFNVSDALSRATGNSISANFLHDPILFGAKFLKKDGNKALRVGGNFKFIASEELGFGFDRFAKDEYYSVGIGFEKRKNIGIRFEYYYGIDLRYLEFTSTSKTFGSNASESVFFAKQNGPGLAPLFGFKWNFSKRFALFTEASISANYINTYRYVNNDGIKSVLENKLEASFLPTMPGAIFLTFEL